MYGRLFLSGWYENASNYPMIKMHSSDFRSVEDLLYYLIKNNAVIIGNERCVTFAEDLHIDLKHGSVYWEFADYDKYVPEQWTKAEENFLKDKPDKFLHINQRPLKFEIMKYSHESKSYELVADEIMMLGYIDNHCQVTKIDIKGLSLTDRTALEKKKSILPIFQKYLVASMPPNKIIDKAYYKDRYTLNPSKENKLIEARGLQPFAGYPTEDSFPFATYNITILKSIYDKVEAFSEHPTNIRRLTFLMAILFDIIDRVEYTDLTVGSMKDLYGGSKLFAKFTSGKCSLVIDKNVVHPKRCITALL